MTLRMVTVEIVINSSRVMGVRVTISCRQALSLMGRCFCFQFLVCFSFVTLRVRSTVRSRGAQFEQALRCRLLADFEKVFGFFGRDCPFRCTAQFSFSLVGGVTNSEKWRSKIAKIQKFSGKACAHHFLQIAEGFFFKSTAVVQGRECRCAAMYIFFRTSLYSADNRCQSSYRQSKNGSNEQGRAHQKSYRK